MRRIGDVAFIRLNDPATLNAMSTPMALEPAHGMGDHAEVPLQRRLNEFR